MLLDRIDGVLGATDDDATAPRLTILTKKKTLACEVPSFDLKKKVDLQSCMRYKEEPKNHQRW